ncbi:MAG: tyrosine-type recombinase/integrase [Gemmatimonadetes bacterium]|nr:tyrosine-type recombinase/integrase [Gemmatimonadota bacterium]
MRLSKSRFDMACVLNAYLDRTERRDDPDGLLFPSPSGQMLTGDFRHWIARIVQEMNREAERCGIAPLAKRITPHGFRHTFTAARIR